MKLYTQFLFATLVIFGVSLGTVNNAYADYKKEPVQEFLDVDSNGYEDSTEVGFDHTPQAPPPDVEDVMDANDAEVTTPIVSFVFWALMGAFGVGACVYILARFGGFGKQQA